MTIMFRTLILIASIQFAYASSESSLDLHDGFGGELQANLKGTNVDFDCVASLPVVAQSRIFLTFDVDIFGELSRVSSLWQIMFDNPELWKIIGLEKYGLYFSSDDLKETPKQRVIGHYLSVIINLKFDIGEVERMVGTYGLQSQFEVWFHGRSFSEFILNLLQSSNDLDQCCSQGNELASNIKIGALIRGRLGYPKNIQAAIKLNEILVLRNNSNDIDRKLDGLKDGGRRFVRPANPDKFSYSYHYNLSSIRNLESNWSSYGYTRNEVELKNFIEKLVQKANPKGVEEKLYGLRYGKNGYEKDPKAAMDLNEALVEQDDQEAIERKIWGLGDGGGGYSQDTQIARQLNEMFVMLGDPRAIERKFEGLSFGRYGYERDFQAAREFNDALVEQGDFLAIERKIKKLTGVENSVYEKDFQEARKLNDSLIAKQNHEAIEKKLQDLLEKQFRSECIYEFNPDEAIKVNEELISNGDVRAVLRKIKGLYRGEYGYEKSSKGTREYIEQLLESDFVGVRRLGYYLKIFSLKYGILGYPADRQEATRCILMHSVPF